MSLLKLTRRSFFFSLFLLAALGLLAFTLSGTASARQSSNVPTSSPQEPATQDAYAELVPRAGAPPNGGTVNVGAKFTLDLMLRHGSNNDLTASQQYLTFTYTVLQVVQPAGTSCVPTSTITPDQTMFETVLQNELCNGPGSCTFRGSFYLPGELSFASGALTGCPQGCGGDFRVASITMCAANGGQGVLHWQFAPPAPVTRDTEIVNINSQVVSNHSLYHDYVINVSGPTATPDRNATPIRTPTSAAQPTNTPSSCTINFTDVHQGDEFYDYIKEMYCRHIVSGYSDHTFRPYEYTLRAQVAKMAVLGFGLPIDTSGGPHFTDVQQGTEFYNYIETAAKHNIVSGFDGRLFKPWDNVKRGQIAKIVVLTAQQKDPANWTLQNPATPSFHDVPRNNTFYQYVETAKAHNMISGFAGGIFGLYDLAKRGQISKILDVALTGQP